MMPASPDSASNEGQTLLDQAEESPETSPPAPIFRRRVAKLLNGKLCISVSSVQNTSSDDAGTETEGISEAATSVIDEEKLMATSAGSFGFPTSDGSISLQSYLDTPFGRGGVLAAELEDIYLQERSKILENNGCMYSGTPLTVLQEMAGGFGAVVHTEVHELRRAQDTRFMIEVFVGHRKGCGESSSLKLSTHLAAVDLLNFIKSSVGHDVPTFYLVPGCRIAPRIFADLSVLCEMLDAQNPAFIEIPRDPMKPDGPLFTFKCQIGKSVCIGESDSKFLAKRLAAKIAFELLSGEELVLDSVSFGSDCVTFKQHGLTLRSSQKKLDMMNESCNMRRQVNHRTRASTRVDPEEGDFGDEMDHCTMGDEKTKARMKLVMESMTEETKARLKTLQITEVSEEIAPVDDKKPPVLNGAAESPIKTKKEQLDADWD